MVSFFSLFLEKRPDKAALSSESPTLDRENDAGPSTLPIRPRPASRFLSLRSRSSSRPYDLASHRTDTDSSRRESLKQNGLSSELPKLDLGLDVQLDGDETKNQSGSEELGRRPGLTKEDLEILDRQTLSCEEVALGWKCFGWALWDTGTGNIGIWQSTRRNVDLRTQKYLLALFLLSIRPSLAPALESLISGYPPSSAGNQAAIWSDRLARALKANTDPDTLVEALKWTLRRLVVPKTVPAGGSSGTISHSNSYQRSVDAENAGSNLTKAYASLQRLALRPDAAAYLDEIFEVWLLTRSKEDTEIGGQLGLMLGFWVSGSSPGEEFTDWGELYEKWTEAGKWIRHLYCAWLRDQSTHRQMPDRIMQQVSNYPFGESSPSSQAQHSKSPPSSSRQTLHLRLSSSTSIPDHAMDPAQILQAAVSTEADQDVSSPIWDTLRRQVAVSSIDEWLSVDSRAFLDSIRAKQSDSRRTEKEPLTSSALTDDNGGPLYRPFSILSPQTSPNHSPRRSQSYGDLLSPINSNGDGKLPRSATGNFSTMMTSKPKIHTLPRLQTHLPTTQQPTSPSVWEDFEKNGFPDSPDTVNLTLSPGPVSAPISPVTPMTPFTSSTDCSDLTRSHNHMMASPIELSASCSIAFEDVVELDHLFMSFVEDGQLDPAAVVAWPSFTLVRLKRPVPAGDSPDKPIEWLLVSVENRSAPPVKASAQPNIANTSSPEAVPSSSRPNLYGMRDLTGSFRRSSSNGQKSGLRESILGMSGRSLSKQAGRTDPLPPLSENVGTVQTASVTSESLPRDTPDESGHSIVVPPGASSVRSTSSSQTSGRTSAISDWVYQTEGGAHMIFACRNKSSPYNGQVLRLRKTDIYAENEGIQAEWRESLLSKLVPPCSLARMREVKLEESWVRELWVKAEAAKPKSRKLKDGCLRGAEITSSRAYLMKDLAAGINPAEQTVLCIEIKPKWGFLPSPDFLLPAESVPTKTQHCRFCLHQHLRGTLPISGARYCPLDLYSGDDVRMMKALDGLWGLWSRTGGEGNNWRVSVDGKEISPAEAELIPGSLREANLTARTAPFVIPLLRSSNVLSHLKSLQSSLDPTDISQLDVRFRAAHPNAELFDPELVPEPTPTELADFVSLYLSDPSAGKRGDTWSLRQRLIAYSLSAIFKDCSIFFKAVLSRSPAGDPILDQKPSTVKLIDLDLKPMQSLRKWAELDEKIWRNWLETKGGDTRGPETCLH